MPEALALLAVFIVAIAAWLGARLHARSPGNYNPVEDAKRLRLHADWLAERLEMARREKWGGEMVAELMIDLDRTSAQLVLADSHLGRSGARPLSKTQHQDPADLTGSATVGAALGASLANMRSNASMCSRAFLRYASSSSQN
jgi:hypothetical protein